MDVKAKYYLLETKNAGRGDRMEGALVTSRRLGDGFAGPGGNSANLEARRAFLRGSWRLCTPSLIGVYCIFYN